VIARLVGLAVDARAIDPATERSEAASWIAGNLVGIGGAFVPANVAAIAREPALLDPADVPWHWRFVLRAVGMPLAG